jgi:hypothetical protein
VAHPHLNMLNHLPLPLGTLQSPPLKTFPNAAFHSSLGMASVTLSSVPKTLESEGMQTEYVMIVLYREQHHYHLLLITRFRRLLHDSILEPASLST